MQQRLDTLFSSLAERANLDGEKMPIHLEKEGVAPALHVFFNHGIDPDPKFSGTLSGYLELNEDRDYCFVIRGRQRAEACERREVLLQGVNEVEYAFLFLVESGEFQEKRHWRGTESEPLYGLRIRVGRCNAKNLEFAFWLPTPPRPLLFERAIGINGSAKKMDRDATANSVEKNCVLL